MPSMLAVLLAAPMVLAHTPAAIYRYPGYTGCDQVMGTVIAHLVGDIQNLILNLNNLQANATGFIQVRDGVNCFDEAQLGDIWMPAVNGSFSQITNPDAFNFTADANGRATSQFPYAPVTVDSLMARSMIVLLANNGGGMTPIGCGNVGAYGYFDTLKAYGNIPKTVTGSVAVTGPLIAGNFSEPPGHGSRLVQLAYSFRGLSPNAAGNISVWSGNSCGGAQAVGALFGTNWTNMYQADANGVAVGNADITFTSFPNLGVQDYYNRTVVLFDGEGSPIACAVLACPPGSVEEGQTDGMNMQHGKCVPSVTWINSSVIAGNFYIPQPSVDVRSGGVQASLPYGSLRSLNTCSSTGSIFTTFNYSTGSLETNSSVGGVRVVILGSKQPAMSMENMDDRVTVNFLRSTGLNVYDVVNVACGVDVAIFHVAVDGEAGETTARVSFGSSSGLTFPTSSSPLNVTFWVTNTAGNVLYQTGLVAGGAPANAVWVLYGNSSTASPIAVTSYPAVLPSNGAGMIPGKTQASASLFCTPSFLVAVVALVATLL